MRLGISSYTYTWACGVPGYPPERPVDALELVERAAEHEVEVLQIADNVPLGAATNAQLTQLLERANRNGIDLEVGTRGIDSVNLHSNLRIAEKLGSPLLRVVVDTHNDHPTPDDVIRRLAPRIADFEHANVVLALENHDRFQTADLVRIIHSLDSPFVGICLDTVNSFGALQGPDIVVHALAPLTVNLHVKDFTIERPSHSMGFIVAGTAAGSGMLNIPEVLAQLRKHNRDCSAILELWTPPQVSLSKTIRLEEQWARQSIRYLRQIV